jgi:hypothetical protein
METVYKKKKKTKKMNAKIKTLSLKQLDRKFDFLRTYSELN